MEYSDNKVYISWEVFFEDVMQLLRIIKNNQNVEDICGIVCISRGGLIPSAIISNHLNIRNLEMMSIVSYTEDSKYMNDYVENVFLRNSLIDQGKGWIVIDDLIDTGRTYDILTKYLSNALFYTVYKKIDLAVKKVEYKNYFYYKYYKISDWLVFPWEV